MLDNVDMTTLNNITIKLVWIQAISKHAHNLFTSATGSQLEKQPPEREPEGARQPVGGIRFAGAFRSLSAGTPRETV